MELRRNLNDPRWRRYVQYANQGIPFADGDRVVFTAEGMNYMYTGEDDEPVTSPLPQGTRGRVRVSKNLTLGGKPLTGIVLDDGDPNVIVIIVYDAETQAAWPLLQFCRKL